VRIIIGKDTRNFGYMLESSLEAGICSMGGEPYLVGVLPTPGCLHHREHARRCRIRHFRFAQSVL
jgi:phosphoglucosamine mutase